MPFGSTLLFACSVRPKRNNDRVLKLLEKRLKQRGHDVQIVDPMVLNLPMLTTPWAFYTDPEQQAPKCLRDLVHLVQSASNIVLTTAEYNRSVPPALTNLLDHLPHSAFAYKPAGVISYSPSPNGGQLSAPQLRQTLSDLGCLVIPHTMVLYSLNNRVSADGEPLGTPEQCQSLLSELDLVLQQVEYLNEAMTKFHSTTKLPMPKIHPDI